MLIVPADPNSLSPLPIDMLPDDEPNDDPLITDTDVDFMRIIDEPSIDTDPLSPTEPTPEPAPKPVENG